MRFKNLFFLLIALLISNTSFSQYQKDISRLFKKSDNISTRVQEVADEIISLKIDKNYLHNIYQENNFDISITIPISKSEDVTLELEQFKVLSDRFILRTSNGDTIKNYKKGMFYTGQIKGKEGFATLSVFDNHVMGIISIKDVGNYNVVKLEDRLDDYVVYNDMEVKIVKTFECHTPDDEGVEIHDRKPQMAESRSGECVKFYIEGDYALNQNKGGVGPATDYITAVFAEMAILYDNEGISTEISEIMVWTSPDGYDTNDSGIALDQFGNNNPNFNGDLASLYALGGNGTGGLAWVDVLCGWNPYAYMNIGASYNNVPAYSWTVEVVTHEVGHNFGSRHTHACVWNGNNTQIDDCGNQYSFNNGQTPEGQACFNSGSPIIPSSGTIMSYCHLLSGVGIDFNLGFGAQPGALIESNYSSAGCLTACGSGGASPVADFEGDPTEICEGQDVYFSDLSTNDPTAWVWTFEGGDPEDSDQESPIVTYFNSGVFDVDLEVSNSFGSDSKTEIGYITVYDVAEPYFTYTIVNDTEVHFTNSSFLATEYYWDFGDSEDSEEENPVHTYDEDGYYTVTLFASNNECTTYEEYTIEIEIVTPPSAGMVINSNHECSPATIEFNNASSENVETRKWIFEGGTPAISNLKNPDVVYNNVGLFDVTLIVSNSLYSDTIIYVDTINIHTIPNSGFLYSSNGNMVTFNNTTIDGDTYEWNYGDGATSTDTNSVHNYIEGGDYEVRLIATNECGNDTTIKNISLTLEANAAFSVDTTKGCASFSAQFHNLSNSPNVSWIFEGGMPNTSTVENPIVVYNTPGLYDVILYATNALGTDTLVMQDYIEVFAQPTGSFTHSESGYVANFTQTTTNISSFMWEFGDGTISEDINPSHIYAEDGTYNVKFIYSNNCGTFEDIQQIIIANPPSAAFTFNNTSGCKPLTVQFTNNSSSNSDSYLWTFEGGTPSTSTDENPMVTFNDKGQFDVSLKVTNEVSSNTKTEVDLVDVYGPPVPDFTHSSSELNYNFNYSGETATQVKWFFGDGSSANGQTASHTYLSEGTYTVKVIAENECGEDILERMITVALKPTAQFAHIPSEGCAPLQVQFTNLSSSANSVLWNFEGGNPAISAEANPTVNYILGGEFDVKLIAFGDNGNDTLELESVISVDAGPVVDYSFNVNEATVSYNNNSSNDASTFYWDFGDGNISEDENPVHVYTFTGTYTVTLYANNDCGQQSISKEVTVETTETKEVDFKDVKLYPNPNDGQFTLNLNIKEGGEYKVNIYNISGKLFNDRNIYLSSGENSIKYNISNLNSGIYIINISNQDKSYKMLFDIQ